MTDSSDYATTWRMRRHTGAVGLMVTGERPAPRTGPEIAELARRTDFFEGGRLTTQHDQGSVEYVPVSFSRNVLAEMFVRGRLIFKFTINGRPPDWLGGLDSGGTYYLYVDFVEGPDYDEGRWVGRIIDEQGTVVGRTTSVEVKQIFYFHIDEQDAEEHNKPKIEIHGLGAEDVADFFSSRWHETLSDWHPVSPPGGHGCQCTHTCTDIYIPAKL
ncbi:MAG: hypothetical protein ACRDTR_11985 [Rubrobacter sp.]